MNSVNTYTAGYCERMMECLDDLEHIHLYDEAMRDKEQSIHSDEAVKMIETVGNNPKR